MGFDPKEKNRPWLLPDDRKREIRPGFYIVPTPIGNLGDITLRALDVLSGVDFIVCEDTRITGKLLKFYGISQKMISYNDHSDGHKRAKILEKLTHDKSLALVSDAGMPLISDPGFKLVRDCIDLGIYLTSLPGANAPLTALQLSGMPSDAFSFPGFLPNKREARKNLLQRWRDVPGTLIFFETAPRLLKSLGDIRDVLGERDVAVVREISKIHEQIRRENVSRLIDIYEEDGLPKGEIVLVITPAEKSEISEEDIIKLLEKYLCDMSVKDAASSVAKLTGKPRRELYQFALEISKQ